MPQYTPESEDAGKYVVTDVLVGRGVRAKSRQDFAEGATCPGCMFWYPGSYLVEVDGRRYCRRDAPMPNPFLTERLEDDL
jgi:hypothetical protein